MKRFLVTTALEKTWRDDQPVLFLGEWCRLNHRKQQWQALDAAVLPYHWDDRSKLYADYRYLLDFHERLLADLAQQLNRIHGVDHGLRYWRILVGPWLGYFIQMLFDRWTAIQQAIGTHDLSGTVILTGNAERLIPNDMSEFVGLFVGDEWNHLICAEILQRFTKVPCIAQARPLHAVATPAAPAASRGLRRTARNWYARAARVFSRERDAFFLSTYLPLRDEIKLCLRLGQVPQPWRAGQPARIAAEPARRQWQVAGDSRSGFETCARAMISSQIPVAYLEGYRKLIEQVRDLPWPKQPKLIWTSNAANSNDVFKAWAGEKVEQGSPLVIGQHGGHYGVGRWSFVEDHEIAIADAYLSWGWSEAGQPKIKPLGQLKAKRPLGVRHAAQAGLLLVTTMVPRYSYFMYSIMVGRQWLDYFDDQCAFIRALPKNVQDASTVRLQADDYGWDQVARWRAACPDVLLDAGHANINDLIRRSRLFVSTYNATTFLESFNMDIPTVMFWNPDHWELRESASPCFDELKSVGIFHETPAAAARHVAAIWDDVEAWWSSPAVRAAVRRFSRRYCHVPPDLLDRVEACLRTEVAQGAALSAGASSHGSVSG